MRVRSLSLLTFAAFAPAQQWTALDGPQSLDRFSAWDPHRGRLVTFSGTETFELDGLRWLHRPLPGGTAAPPARVDAGMAYDEQRRHVLMFGGYLETAGLRGDTWTYDGYSWRQLTAGPQPLARRYASMVYDPRRATVLMLGGQTNGSGPDGTWEHDGGQWLSRGTAGPPGASCMACDRARGVVVMVLTSPSTSGGPISTWEWNGTVWLQRATAQAPQVGSMSIAYDPLRQRIVMLGGFRSDGVWEWNGNAWTLVATLTESPRLHPALWFDAALGKLVFAGGKDVRWIGTTLGGRTDAWTWDGATMAPLRRDLRPPARDSHALFADIVRDRVVLFGGARWPLPSTDDTWIWDGNTWTESQPANRPPPRRDAATAFEWTRGQGLLFGGLGLSGQPVGDLWSWDGTDWSFRSGGGPTARSGACMSYDLQRDVTVLFGGLVSASISAADLRNDTWEWTGAAWLQRTAAVLPLPRTGAAMAFDPTRNRTVMYGGRAGPMVTDLLGDVWEWDGAIWQQTAAPLGPPLLSASLNYDLARLRTVLTGTDPAGGGYGVFRVWEFDGVGWTQVWSGNNLLQSGPCTLPASSSRLACSPQGMLHEFSSTLAAVDEVGAGCGAPAMVLSARTRPRVGDAGFGVESAAGPGLAMVCGFSTASGSASLGNGCTVWLGLPSTGLFTLAGPNGMAVVPLPIPPLFALRGFTLFAQAAVLDPASPGGLRLSQGLRFQVGD